MSEQVLTLLKFGLLALLYLFFARTLWAVWSEVRATATVGGPVRNDVGRAKMAAPKMAPAQVAPVQVASGVAETPDAPPAPSTPTAPSAPPIPSSAGQAPETDLPSGKLVVVEPAAQRGVSWPLGKELTIGRAPGCGVPIDDTFVSQLHARVWVTGGTWMVEDLGSTNGTVFNGDALTEPRVMKMGDQIRLGSTVLELR